jgi:hypothetical protein
VNEGESIELREIGNNPDLEQNQVGIEIQD